MKRQVAYQGFPIINAKNWFRVRNQIKQNIPRVVTPEYLAPCLEIGSLFSINANVIVSLKQMHLLDETGAPTELLKKWRIDAKYAEVCELVIKNTYPNELVALLDSPDCTRNKVKDWFLQEGYGSESARRMATTFLMLAEQDYTSSKYLGSDSLRPSKKSAASKVIRTSPYSNSSSRISRGQFDLLISDEELNEKTNNLFFDGHYARAVEEAYKFIDNLVKERVGSFCIKKSGAGLMREAFSPNNPILKVGDCKTHAGTDEQQGYMDILAGCMTGIRNPRVHDTNYVDQKDEAFRLLGFANHLVSQIRKAQLTLPGEKNKV